MHLRPLLHLTLVVLVGLAVWAPAPARAGAPTDQLKASVEQIIKVATAPRALRLSRPRLSRAVASWTR